VNEDKETKMAIRIGVSPLTGRIFRGRVSKDGDVFIGEKEDVTSDVLRAVLEKAEFHGGTFDIEGGGRKWTVTVSGQQAQCRCPSGGGSLRWPCPAHPPQQKA
jgi:hypothetical protein